MASCVASTEADASLPFDPGPVCQCAAEAVIAQGVRPADLDGILDYVGDDQTFDAAAMPDAAQAVASMAMASLQSCALAASPEALRVSGQTPAVDAVDLPVKTAPTQMGGSGASGVPSGGVRLGSGPAPKRTEQAGPGAAIRIVG